MEFFKNKRNLIIFSIIAVILYTALTSFISISIYKNHLQKELKKTFSEAFDNAFGNNNSGNNTDSNPATSGTVTENKKDTFKSIKLNETFATKNWEITLTSAEVTENYNYDKEDSWDNSIKNYTRTADADETFVLLEGKLKNIGAERETIDSYGNSFRAICDDKYSYTMTIDKNPREDYSFSTSLDPLESVNIQILGNVKKEALGSKITIELKIDGETFRMDKQI